MPITSNAVRSGEVKLIWTCHAQTILQIRPHRAKILWQCPIEKMGLHTFKLYKRKMDLNIQKNYNFEHAYSQSFDIKIAILLREDFFKWLSSIASRLDDQWCDFVSKLAFRIILLKKFPEKHANILMTQSDFYMYSIWMKSDCSTRTEVIKL